WGLISTARINRALIKPLRASERNELVAVASRSLEKAQNYAAEWEIPQIYGSYQAMLDDPEIDVVYNSLPNHLHTEWTVKALRAGKHVLCEKPLAISLEEVDAMSAAVEETGNVLAEAFMYRHHPQTLKVRELVESGVLGDVQVIKGAFTFTLTNPGDVRLYPEMGGGSVWDVGCYPVSFSRFILGSEPLEAFGWQITGETGIDEVFTGQLRFRDNVVAQFDCGFRSPFRARMVVIGSEATLVIPNPFRPGIDDEIRIVKEDEVQRIKTPGQELYIGEVEDMADAILKGTPPRISLEDSRNNVATILALLRSAQENSPVEIA
ncbi:MAG: Gfo/Idh/MocA family oxidoreductase, partial [Anaerolineales bacterium]